MMWVKKKDTQEAVRFWSHVESVAERVRTSDVYANNRVPQESSQDHAGQRCDAQEAPIVRQAGQVSNRQ